MSIFLSKEEVKQLTSSSRRLMQIEVLRNQGIQFYINRSGWPVVPKEAITGSLSPNKPTEWQPNINNK